MSMMAKTPSGYKKIGSAYIGEHPVDKVFNANGDVVYALQRELTGVPPLLFKGKEQSELLNYRIYGDTVDGKSVGDRTGNLFDISTYPIISGKILYANDGHVGFNANFSSTETYIPCEYLIGKTLTLNKRPGGVHPGIAFYDESENYISGIENNGGTAGTPISFTVPQNAKYYRFSVQNGETNIQINEGSTALPYEPYGYKVPVTVEGTNLLDENTLINPIGNISWYFDDEHYLLATNKSTDTRGWGYGDSQFYIALSSGSYTFQLSGVAATNQYAGVCITKSNNEKIYFVVNAGDSNIVTTFTLNTPETIGIEIKVYDGKYRIMLNKGSTALPYEPYHAPVTTPIYLPEPIKMVGDEAEYIDYGQQKQHRVRKNLAAWDKQWEIAANGLISANNTSYSSIIDVHNIDYIYLFGDANKLNSYIYRIGKSNILPEIGANMTRITSTGGLVNVSDCNYCLIACQLYGTSTTRQDLLNEFMITAGDTVPSKFEPYIENTDLNVTLPALPALTGINTMSVDTVVQPSRMDIKGRIKSLT